MFPPQPGLPLYSLYRGFDLSKHTGLLIIYTQRCSWYHKIAVIEMHAMQKPMNNGCNYYAQNGKRDNPQPLAASISR